ASGGRYDALVGRFCPDASLAAGTGFGFDVEAIRELLGSDAPHQPQSRPWLVASTAAASGSRWARLAELHRNGEPAELCPTPCPSQEEADRIAVERGCRGALWLAA
ncbi:MAG: ATP phosphoribosyltransferase regulatory subunit, partial [Cyanobacteriota bacterium]